MHFHILNRFLMYQFPSGMSLLPVLCYRLQLYQSCGNGHEPSQTSRNPNHSNAFACWHESKGARVKHCSIENGNLHMNSEKDE